MEKDERFESVRLLRTARELNDDMIDYWTEKIVLETLKINKPQKDVKICVKGITYRQGVTDSTTVGTLPYPRSSWKRD